MESDRTDNLRIHEADYADAAHARAIVELVDGYARDPMGGGQPLGEYARQKLVAGLRDHPTSLVLLAFVDDQPAGIAVCFLGYSTFAGRRQVNVHDLAVQPDFRRRGIARRLLEAVERKAQALDCCRITLEVRDDNHTAKQFYHSLGFGTDDPGANNVAMLFLKKRLGKAKSRRPKAES